VTVQQTPNLIDPATFDAQYLGALTTGTGTSPTNVSAPAAATLAGATWTAMSADVAILTPSGTQYAHAVAMTATRKGYAYTTVRLVPVTDKTAAQSAFDTAERASFQPMLATFTFTG
jgi:hypothetical protein